VRNPFVEFLVERGFLSAEVARWLSGKGKFVREPIGAIAVCHGMLRPDQIDVILDRQGTSGNLFGEIAVEMGFMTKDQIDLLIRVQAFRACADIAETLILGGALSYEDAVQNLGVFLAGDREVVEMMADE